jgi:hypothetical protein
MSTSVITVRDVQEKSKDGSTWLELTDQNNRTHRIFRRVQDNDGNWHDLSSKYEMLRKSEKHTLRLTTEQKGRFINVLNVEQVENEIPHVDNRTHEERETECRLKTFTTAYAKDLAVAGKIPAESILGWSEVFFRYLQGEVTVGNEEIEGILKRSRKKAETIASGTAKRKASPSREMESV